MVPHLGSITQNVYDGMCLVFLHKIFLFSNIAKVFYATKQNLHDVRDCLFL